MIFVTIGLTKPFDRLLDMLQAIAEGEALVVQAGDSDTALAPTWRRLDYIPFDDLVAYVRKAEAVISHAGVGSILVAIANGKRPIVVPRRSQYGEAADDHQVALARRLASLGLVTVAESPEDLQAALRASSVLGEAGLQSRAALTEDLGRYVAAHVAS